MVRLHELCYQNYTGLISFPCGHLDAKFIGRKGVTVYEFMFGVRNVIKAKFNVDVFRLSGCLKLDQFVQKNSFCKLCCNQMKHLNIYHSQGYHILMFQSSDTTNS